MQLTCRAGARQGIASNDLDHSVVVTVIPVRMMQMPIHQVVNVIAMRYGRVTTVWSMHMIIVMTFALVRRAGVRIDFRNRNYVLVVMILVSTVQMAIVQIADVITVLDSDMAAAWTVHVLVVFVNLVAHGVFSRLLMNG